MRRVRRWQAQITASRSGSVQVDSDSSVSIDPSSVPMTGAVQIVSRGGAHQLPSIGMQWVARATSKERIARAELLAYFPAPARDEEDALHFPIVEEVVGRPEEAAIVCFVVVVFFAAVVRGQSG